MGIDACIYVKMRDGVSDPRLEQPLPDGFKLEPNPEWGIIRDATHRVDNYARFYGPYYARGPWPTLSAALMLLLNSPDVEKVWYCGDDGEETEEPWTAERQAEYTAYFITHGRREYQGPWRA